MRIYVRAIFAVLFWGLLTYIFVGHEAAARFALVVLVASLVNSVFTTAAQGKAWLRTPLGQRVGIWAEYVLVLAAFGLIGAAVWFVWGRGWLAWAGVADHLIGKIYFWLQVIGWLTYPLAGFLTEGE